MSEPKRTFVMPIMSWDKPIEEEILGFVQQMRRSMEMQANQNIWGRTRKDAALYANAYKTVETHIIKEIEFRKEVKKSRDEL